MAEAWYRYHCLMAIDGSSLSVPGEEANRRHFGLPDASRGQAGLPKRRLSVQMELGTRVPSAWCSGPWSELEMEQAERLVPHLKPNMLMLMLADRYGDSFSLWSRAHDRGADLIWRVKSNQALPVHRNFPDGSWSNVINGSDRNRRRLHGQTVVRVVRYQTPGSEEAFTLVTTLLARVQQAPAAELAALYRERWEIKTTCDKVRAHILRCGFLLRNTRCLCRYRGAPSAFRKSRPGRQYCRPCRAPRRDTLDPISALRARLDWWADAASNAAGVVQPTVRRRLRYRVQPAAEAPTNTNA